MKNPFDFLTKEEPKDTGVGQLDTFNRVFRRYKLVIIAYLALSIILMFLLVGLVAKLETAHISDLLAGGEITYTEMDYWGTMYKIRWAILVYWVFMIGYGIKFMYGVWASYRDLGQNIKGSARWATHEEIDATYKKVPEKTDTYAGKGGIPIARDGKGNIYIEDGAVNNLIIGTTRSGKGEEHVFPSVDIYSRAEDKASLIITDPKLEIAPAAIKTLEKRGYDCYVLNLIDSEYSMFYNPLPVIVQEIKDGDTPAAQQLCRSLAFNVFAENPNEKDPFWTEQARNVFIAAVMADIEDNLAADKEINNRRQRHHDMMEEEKKERAIASLDRDDMIFYYIKSAAMDLLDKFPKLPTAALYENLKRATLPSEAHDHILMMSEKTLMEYLDRPLPRINYRPKKFIPTTENEEKINLYSIVKLTNTLHSINLKNGTALDHYFENRPESNFARQTYASVRSASDQTKGTIMSVFQKGTSIFLYDNIGRMMSQNSVDFIDVGFGNKPIAIFIGLPDYDQSNWFISTVFINQLYFTLAKMATAAGGRTYRDVVFLLDEFGNMPAFDNLEGTVTVCLGRGIRFNFIVQSFAQLYGKYGEEVAETILDNCGTLKYILTTNDKTAERISGLLGNTTKSTFNRTGKIWALNKEQTEMQEEVPLMRSNDLLKLQPEETIVIRYLKRQGLDKKPVIAHPIYNTGEYAMKFRYKYLSDDFPTGSVLYRSKNMDRILAKNYNTTSDEMEIADVTINITTSVDLDKISRSGREYLKAMNDGETLIKDIKDEKIRTELFDLMKYPEEKREIVLEGEDPAYAFTVADFVDYANNLIHNYELYKDIGFKMLDILVPLDYSKYDPRISYMEDFDAIRENQNRRYGKK